MKENYVLQIRSIVDRIKASDFDMSRTEDYIDEIKTICPLPVATDILRKFRDHAIASKTDQPTQCTLNCLAHIIGWTAFPENVQKQLRDALIELNSLDDRCAGLTQKVLRPETASVGTASDGTQYVRFHPRNEREAEIVREIEDCKRQMTSLTAIIVKYDHTLKNLPKTGIAFGKEVSTKFHTDPDANLVSESITGREFLERWLNTRGYGQ